MSERPYAQDHLAAAEYHILRREAVETLEHCLLRGEDGEFIAFMEAQIATHPPRLNLLRDIAGELLLRLLTLRQQRLDVCARVIGALRTDYGLDMTHCCADSPERYARISVDDLLIYAESSLSDEARQDLPLIRAMVQASVEAVRQLSADIELTEQLHNTLGDWLLGLSSRSSHHLLSRHALAEHRDEPSRLH
jgi:hypothetical protein